LSREKKLEDFEKLIREFSDSPFEFHMLTREHGIFIEILSKVLKRFNQHL